MAEKKNTMTVQSVVLEYRGGEFKSDDGRDIVYKKAIILMGGREIIVNCDTDLTAFVDKDCVVELRMTPKNQKVSYTVVSCKVI